MFKSVIKYLLVFFVSIAFVYQFQGTISKLRLIPTGFLKLIFPQEKKEPTIDKEVFSPKTEIINANSFEVHVSELEYFSGYNKNKDGTMHAQHKSSALYASITNQETFLELYTRDGFLITKDGITKFDLPKNYDSHNSQGGIRGIFFVDEEVYGFMATKKIGCQNMSLINLSRNVEIFDTDCLPDFQGIHYDGVGGASIHNEEIILLSVGAPTNNSQPIRDLAQDNDSFYGKIISINKNNIKNYLKGQDDVKTEIYTKGHRNPQGLLYLKEANLIFETEHGPIGGDEINLINLNDTEIEKNYGWPIASYGLGEQRSAMSFVSTNKKYKSHEGFIEPIKYYVPSVGISEIVKVSPSFFKKNSENYDFFISTLGTKISEGDMSLHHIELDKNSFKILSENIIPIQERMRDAIYHKKSENLILFID